MSEALVEHRLKFRQRKARYHEDSQIVGAQPLIVEGAWHGEVLRAPRGDGGFGYDPVFLDRERGLSAAQIEPAEKNCISHRGIALARLRQRLAEL